MKHYYSEFTKEYVQDICNAINSSGQFKKEIVLTNHGFQPFVPENFKSLTSFLQDYVVYHQDMFTFLDQKGLVNRGKCPYTGKQIDNYTSPSWSYMGNRRVFVSQEGYKIMQNEDNEEGMIDWQGNRVPSQNTSSKTDNKNGIIKRIKQLNTGTKRLLWVICIAVSLLLPPIIDPCLLDYFEEFLVVALLIFVAYWVLIRVSLWIIDGYKK